jgi:chemotaxis protein histidine kinase CheA
MNREIKKLLEDKWVLVAADFIAVLGVLLIGLNPRDGFEGFLAVVGILGASLIVVIPVLKEGGGKRERLAEQARLRAALAEEIDRLRDDFRATIESVNRRVVEVELSSRKAGEAAVAALAQKASAEINALKAAVADLDKKLQAGTQESARSAEVKESVEELGTRLEELAKAVRGAVADTEEAAESSAAARTEAEAEIKALREELKKSGQRADRSVAQVESALESVREELRQLRANPPAASAPSPASVQDEEPEADPVTSTAPTPSLPDDRQVAAEIEEEEDIVEDEDEEEGEEEDADEPSAAPASTDEASTASGNGTALIVNLMIGIGNKPFVRGKGPGLSQDKGVPMTFLGIGRWQWVSPAPDAPATVEVWKNDQSPLGEPLHLSGGETVEVDESHFTGA